MISSDFIDSLSEDELGFLLHFVNNIKRPLSHNIPFEIPLLKAFNKDGLIQSLLNSFQDITEEGHPIFVSLMEKFGVKVEIKKEQSKIEPPVQELPEVIVSPPIEESKVEIPLIPEIVENKG